MNYYFLMRIQEEILNSSQTAKLFVMRRYFVPWETLFFFSSTLMQVAHEAAGSREPSITNKLNKCVKQREENDLC